jgi:hypothetical protein
MCKVSSNPKTEIGNPEFQERNGNSQTGPLGRIDTGKLQNKFLNSKI